MPLLDMLDDVHSRGASLAEAADFKFRGGRRVQGLEKFGTVLCYEYHFLSWFRFPGFRSSYSVLASCNEFTEKSTIFGPPC